MDSEWIPPEVDSRRPSVARVYDFLLGGAHNFASDRDLATGLLRVEPQARELARANRAFLRRAVRTLAASGVAQFVDIGSGIPTQGNVHEVAQSVNPGARVVYVDNDDVAVAHSRSILAGNDQAAVLQADMRRPADILADPELKRLVDLSRPVAFLLVAALHLVKPEEDPDAIVATLRDAAAPGSHLVISHLTHEAQPGKTAAIGKLYDRASSPAVARSHAEILRFFDGWELLDPGLVYVPLWRPDEGEAVESPERFLVYGGVGRLP
ncbi:S-adenosyl methyltransferase [Actinomadura meyerae]|uniref:S-adenosyl methyltransferase n=1 Tax=Actinomadura meyerae TaxID=240840 RepID=A0A239N1Z9_9ACTN|nr:SAM-dependent methyltransferase [Actinomadura meyerae]SNT48925.1 S-adenosyl methyltransferase [Actinomadura meyerae]